MSYIVAKRFLKKTKGRELYKTLNDIIDIYKENKFGEYY